MDLLLLLFMLAQHTPKNSEAEKVETHITEEMREREREKKVYYN